MTSAAADPDLTDHAAVPGMGLMSEKAVVTIQDRIRHSHQGDDPLPNSLR